MPPVVSLVGRSRIRIGSQAHGSPGFSPQPAPPMRWPGGPPGALYGLPAASPLAGWTARQPCAGDA
jgi:hypothetical protein